MSKADTIKIARIEWGSIETSRGSELAQFKDCKVGPSGAKEWDWRLTGTRHDPGIQLADVEELLEQDIEVLILSRGMQLVLRTHPETIEALRKLGLEHYIEETTAAARRFNALSAAGRRVAGLFHSTC